MENWDRVEETVRRDKAEKRKAKSGKKESAGCQRLFQYEQSL